MDPEAAERCKYFESLFSPYIDGDLDGPERQALAEHLHRCETCAEQFGLTWRAAVATVESAQRRSVSRVRRSRTGLWVLTIGCLVGVLLLGGSNLADGDGRALDPFQIGPRGLVGQEVADMIAVQTELLKAIVEPLRGSESPVSHESRGAALDFFESLRAPPAAPERAEPAWSASFHRLFRAADPLPGGRDWDRTEFLAELARDGLPPIVLVKVHTALNDVMLCSVTWGPRPAYAWLLRERAAASERSPLRLGYLLFASP